MNLALRASGRHFNNAASHRERHGQINHLFRNNASFASSIKYNPVTYQSPKLARMGFPKNALPARSPGSSVRAPRPATAPAPAAAEKFPHSSIHVTRIHHVKISSSDSIVTEVSATSQTKRPQLSFISVLRQSFSLILEFFFDVIGLRHRCSHGVYDALPLGPVLQPRCRSARGYDTTSHQSRLQDDRSDRTHAALSRA